MKHLNIRWGEWLRSAGECCLIAASSDFARGLNWDAVSATAELLGPVGSVVCLACLALQIRHKRESD